MPGVLCFASPAFLPHTIPASCLILQLQPATMAAGFFHGVQEAAAQITAQITAIKIDDSSFPFLQAVVAFIAVEYVWETYLDIRQRYDLHTRVS